MSDGIKTILAFVCGFTMAQAIKFFIALARGEKQGKFMKNVGQAIGYLSRSGGMPSGHAASTMAAATYLGLSQGFDSIYFALAICIAVIVIYDAINVRYAVGEQGKILNLLTKKKMKIVEGHTRREVAAGILLGIVVGWIVYIIFGA